MNIATQPADAPQIPANEKPLKGIRGWLGLLAIWQIYGIIRFFLSWVRHLTSPRTYIAFETAPAAALGQAALNLACFSLMIATLYAFFAKKRYIRPLFALEVLGFSAAIPLDMFWVSVTTQYSFSSLFNEVQLIKFIGSLTLGIPWIIYIYRSRRVTNTFVN